MSALCTTFLTVSLNLAKILEKYVWRNSFIVKLEVYCHQGSLHLWETLHYGPPLVQIWSQVFVLLSHSEGTKMRYFKRLTLPLAQMC